FVVTADATGRVYEHTHEDNNTLVDDRPINILPQPLPDLVPLAPTVAPTAATFGTSITVGWTVRNDGTLAAAGAWSDRVYLSSDAALSADDVLLTTVNSGSDSPLAIGASYSRSTSAGLPLLRQLTNGTYYVLIKADATGAVNELDETNNVVASGPLTL